MNRNVNWTETKLKVEEETNKLITKAMYLLNITKSTLGANDTSTIKEDIL